jgi:hypothetical protein
MSLAVLARKTKTKQRLKSTTCGNGRSRNGQQGRSVGFVLNMTGRGGGIGLSGEVQIASRASGVLVKAVVLATVKQGKLERVVLRIKLLQRSVEKIVGNVGMEV